MTTALSNVIIPEVFAAYVQEISVEKSLLVRSGIISRNTALDSFLDGGGRYVQMPKWQDLGNLSNVNVSSDQASSATVRAVSTRQENAIRNQRNMAFGAYDLTANLAGSDAMDVIANRIADWWVKHDQAMLLDIIAGIMTAYGTSSAGTLLNDISMGDEAGAETADTSFSSADLLDTFQLLGDGKAVISGIVVHSAIHTLMQKQNLVDQIPNSQADVGFGTFMGKALIVDDDVTVTQTDAVTDGDLANTAYDTIVFGEGAFQWGEGSPRVPVAVDRDELTGDGGGSEFLISRREWVLHPYGFTADITTTDALLASSTLGAPTNANYSGGTVYNRVDENESFDRQRDMKFAVLRSNAVFSA